MLGAHGRLGKGLFFEEAARVPLVMSFPGRVPENEIMRNPVSQVDLFATILGYLGASKLDRSDGENLRRYVEKKTYNRNHDERAVVVELENSLKKSSGLDGGAGMPNFMIRYKQFKLMLPKRADAGVVDVLYDLSKGPSLELRELRAVRIHTSEAYSLCGRPFSRLRSCRSVRKEQPPR